MRIDMNNDRDLAAFDVVLNNPLCVILGEKAEKITEREMGDEGKIMSIQDSLVKIVTYKEKSLL
jgi:hypothetical protein